MTEEGTRNSGVGQNSFQGVSLVIRCVFSLAGVWLLLLACGLDPAGAGEVARRLSEPERIAALLEAVERSGAKFVREGKEYSGVAGRRHLERKLRYARQRVKTAEDFIEGIASRSSTTGRPYQVRLPGGDKIESSVWLQQRLAEIDARR